MHGQAAQPEVSAPGVSHPTTSEARPRSPTPPTDQLPAARCPIPNTQYPIPDTRYPIPDTRYPIPDTRYPIPDTRYPIPDAE